MRLTPQDEWRYFLKQLSADPNVGLNSSLCPMFQKLRQLDLSYDQALPFMLDWGKLDIPGARILSDEEVTRAADSVYELKEASSYAKAEPRPWLRPIKDWPEPDKGLTEEIQASGRGLDTLAGMSGPLPTTPAQVLQSLYHDLDKEALICLSIGVSRTITATLGSWIDLMGDAPTTLYDQLVPNPMTALEGASARSGQPFARTRSNATKAPLLHVVEFDGGSFAEQAARIILIQRRTGQTLRMVCWSGSKSLHAYFALRYSTLQGLKVFYELCCRCGADKRLIQPEQLARMPLGIRANNQNLQKILFAL